MSVLYFMSFPCHVDCVPLQSSVRFDLEFKFKSHSLERHFCALLCLCTHFQLSYSKSYIPAYPRFRDLASSTTCLLPWALTPDDFILVPIAKREPYQLFNLSTSLNCWITTTRLRSSDGKEIEKQCQLQILFRQELQFFFFLFGFLSLTKHFFA